MSIFFRYLVALPALGLISAPAMANEIFAGAYAHDVNTPLSLLELDGRASGFFELLLDLLGLVLDTPSLTAFGADSTSVLASVRPSR
jgi:hypothetical protein